MYEPDTLEFLVMGIGLVCTMSLKYRLLRILKVIIDREAGEIIRLVASVCLQVCVCVYVFVSKLSCLYQWFYATYIPE